MKEIRKLNLSEGQILSSKQQDAIVAGKNVFVDYFGSCQCSYTGPKQHTTRIIAYYCPTKEEIKQAQLFDVAAELARAGGHDMAADEYDKMAAELRKEYAIEIGFITTRHQYDKNGKEIGTEVSECMYP